MVASWELNLYGKLATAASTIESMDLADITVAAGVLTQVAMILDYSATKKFLLIGTSGGTLCQNRDDMHR